MNDHVLTNMNIHGRFKVAICVTCSYKNLNKTLKIMYLRES